jgi:hypothetical protein
LALAPPPPSGRSPRILGGGFKDASLSSPMKWGRGTVRRTVVGAVDKRRGHSHDAVHRFVKRAHHVAGGDAHDCHSSRCEPRVAAKVALRPTADIVAHAVDLDRQPGLRAIEIEHIRADRVPTAKYRQSRRALTQPVPQSRLRRGERTPKATGVGDRFRRCSHRMANPLHRPSGGPPPPRSRGRTGAYPAPLGAFRHSRPWRGRGHEPARPGRSGCGRRLRARL